VSVEHYENFPVASVLCPAQLRPAVQAIYAFARTADDLADEGHDPPEQRRQALRAYRHELLAAFGLESPPLEARWPGVFAHLHQVRLAHALPVQPFLRLLDAFERDTQPEGYLDRRQLLEYCALSANPVGHLLLHLYGAGGPVQHRQADAICSALQLINFWQDLGTDLARGRVYLPREDADRHGVSLLEPTRLRDSPATRALVADLCQWARTLMVEGAPLALDLPGRIGWELRLVVQGGTRILDKIARLDHATIARRPVLGPADVPGLLWRAWRMPAALRQTTR
jgi:squalene synthase HpnC